MFYFTRSKKIIFTIVIAAGLILLLSSFSPITHSQTNNNFTLPCTVNTYGNAWSGDIAFDLSTGTRYYLAVMDTNGTVLDVRQSLTTYGAAYNIANDTLMFQGEPQEPGGAPTAPTYATHFWNLSTGATQDFLNVIGEHDIQYDPVNNTFLTMQVYVRTVGNNLILFDKIVQFDPTGNLLWSWDTYNYIPPSEASPFNETTTYNGQLVEDLTHANSLYWDYNNSVIYLNLRVTNTFYKINQTTGNIIWACGEFGNFTLLGSDGLPLVGANGLPPSLWYHSHNTVEVAPDVFTMFDNDFDNNTNPNDCRSSMIEVTLNETNMTAYVNWIWEAPTQYWNFFAGSTLILPNGDYLGDFGDPTHQLPQNQPWNFTDTGAVFVEVNPAGQIVRTFTFPVGYYAYRVETITNPTAGNFLLLPTPSPTPSSIPTTAPTIAPIVTPYFAPSPSPSVTASPTSSPSPTPTIPELQAWIILPFIAVAILSMIFARRRIPKK